MRVGGYLALGWRPSDHSVIDTSRLLRLRGALEDSGDWTLVHNQAGLWVFSRTRGPLRVRKLRSQAGVVIGDVFDAACRPFGEGLDLGLEARPRAIAERLASTAWGSYVAFLPSESGDEVGIFRDPIGGLECVAWRLGGVTIAASELPDALLEHLGPALSIDWSFLAQMVADTSNISGELALKGLSSVFPGTLLQLSASAARAEVIWRPATFARATSSETDAASALARRLDACVGAWAQSYAPVLAEVSGGLDSAIVGSALVRAPNAKVGAWVNYHTQDPLGDERTYASALAGRIGVVLAEAAKPDLVLDPGTLAEVADGPRPSLNAVDIHYDEDMAQRCATAGAEALFTGQGGDALFFQTPTALVVADHLRRRGLAALSSPLFLEVAAWTEQSLWSVGRTALLGWAGLSHPKRREPPPFVSARTRRRAAAGPGHPWLRGLGGLPPAKRLHIEGLAYGLLFFGDCRRGRAASLIHPLLSQPMIELALSIPTDVLVEGGRDRGLARRAFEDRIPSSIIDRRSKGDLTAYYGRAIAFGLMALRPYLIEGRLAAQGVVDPDRLARMLSVGALMHDARYADVMDLVAIEAWVRVWEGRIARLPRPS